MVQKGVPKNIHFTEISLHFRYYNWKVKKFEVVYKIALQKFPDIHYI